MALHVQRQVIGPREAALTALTLERLGARVFAVVSGELVGAGEPPLAALPRAPVGLLACNQTDEQRSEEVRRGQVRHDHARRLHKPHWDYVIGEVVKLSSYWYLHELSAIIARIVW